MEPIGVPPAPPTARRFGQMPPPNPRGGGGGGGGGAHRRSQSETFVRLPDDILFDPDPDFDIDFPSLSDNSVSAGDVGGCGTLVAETPGVSDPAPAARPVSGAHLRSLSLDAAFFDGLGFQAGAAAGDGVGGGGGGAQDRRGHHRRSGSMDGSISSFEGESGASLSDYAKKAMTADKLAELSLLDPKRAKRILANRQSAARSKERKIRYTSELERKVQTLQTEATTLSAQLTLLQRDTTDLTAENRELKLRLQAMEQQAQLRDALNEALREEVQRLKIATGQLPNANGNPFNGGLRQSVSNYYHPQQSSPPSGRQAHHLHPSQAQSSSNGQSVSVHSPNDPMDFM